MRIRNKITITFTLLTGSLLLVIFSFIYYFSYRYTENEFFQRLLERANIIGQSYLEKDELSEQIYNEILEKHWQKLPEEKEFLLQVDIANRRIIDGNSINFPDYFFDQIYNKKYSLLKDEDTYYAGILYIDNEGDFIVTVSAKNLYGEAKMKNLRNILILAFLLGLMVIFIIGSYYAGKVLMPISAVTNKANKISISNLHLRLSTGKSKDELSELSVTFNNMLDRLETSFEIQNNFVNNASHELRNPLTAIMGETEVALNKERSIKEYKNSLCIIEKEAQRLDLLVNSLLKLAQTGVDGKEMINEDIRVDEMVLELKQNSDNINPENNIVLDFIELPEQSDRLIIHGNQSLLKVALNNIIDNACKFSMNKEVIIKISATKDSVDISVKDHGVGIPEHDLKSITQPFYRASNARSFQGFGVGLSMAQKIMQLHHGKMHIASLAGKGTEVIISFPK